MSSLATLLASAKSGDTISLDGTSQGDVAISGKAFSPAVTILGGQFSSLKVSGCSGLHFDGPQVQFVPGPKSVSWSAAVAVNASHDIAFTHAKVVGAPAVNGVAQTALTGDATGNVIGLPCGYGVDIVGSQNVSFTDGEVAQFHRLIVLNNVSDVTLARNNLHDRRTTAIAGAQVSNLTVEGNEISDANPWRWGQTPVGDHADCMAFWSNAGQVTPNDRVRIVGNRMAQLSGATILGMWFQGTAAAPFTDFEISGNVLLVPNLQGIALWQSQNGVIAGNTLIQAQVSGIDPKQRPTILLRAGVSSVSMADNLLGAPISDLSGGQNPQSGNVLLAGFVGAALP